ncbi:MAG: methionine--tRNA ligase [Dehalococcoidia bacterium]|nr:methionine--tRNA ligase [Dehalococcoidia bacterium]
MPERLLVCTAWPYANGPIHLGHVAGAYLPADIFARYHRIKGDQVLMVSGSDQHGTPVTVRAEQEGKPVEEVAGAYHRSFLDTWQRLGISFDLFTSTHTQNHQEVVYEIWRGLKAKGFLYEGKMPLMYCPADDRYLPDRYVTGTCPHCAFLGARGDQCDSCGRPLNGVELIDPVCTFCKNASSTPEMRESQHYFLKLSALNQELLGWVEQRGKGLWRQNVYKFTQNFLSEGLHDRAITRDIEWGVPVPEPGWGRKRIYVWFEACIGYLSATVEWHKAHDDPEGWKDYWYQSRGAKVYNFIGKDNIPFHTIIWPGMLMGYNHDLREAGGEALNLPYEVPANEFLTLEGRKFSTSGNWALWVPDYLERYDPDPLRYVVTANMPESSDTDFSWREFVRRNNDELVAAYGNLVHRVLTFTYRNFEKQVPAPGPLDDVDRALLARADEALAAVATSIEAVRLREAIRHAMALAQDANRYLDDKAPWKSLKLDREATATTLHTALTAIAALKQAFSPFLPFSSQKLHELLGRTGTCHDEGWGVVPPVAGQALPEPFPLFVKLDDKIIEEETARLG